MQTWPRSSPFRPIVVNEYHVCVSGLAFQGWLRASMRTGIFPSEWKMAKASPIFKKGKANDPNNYRPISVISTVAKIFEKVIFEQPYNYLSSNNGFLTYCQSGFRTLHGTLTALFESTSNWSVNRDNGFFNGIIFIDLKKPLLLISNTMDQLSLE